VSAASVLRNLGAIAAARRLPTRRALAALAKVHGRRLERRWPFLPKANPQHMNLQFDDVLELQFARRHACCVMVVGAYDGVANDPLARFMTRHACRGVLVEPQPRAFEQLRANLGTRPGLEFVNAAIDERSGTREFFEVDMASGGLPGWAGQLASFSREHIVRHEDRAPGVSARIRRREVPTLTFDDLLDRFGIGALDVLQIDAEGVDAHLLRCFPFHRIMPGVLHYEIAHMTPGELDATRARLAALGYRLFPTATPDDEMAVRV
jgi:FkbM family methyltransferase